MTKKNISYLSKVGQTEVAKWDLFFKSYIYIRNMKSKDVCKKNYLRR